MALTLAWPAAAAARPCSDRTPFVVDGVSWVLFTGDETPPYKPSCRTARRVARRFLTTGRSPAGWRCRNTASVKRCVRGGTYVDEFGNRQWRQLVGWHGLD